MNRYAYLPIQTLAILEAWARHEGVPGRGWELGVFVAGTGGMIGGKRLDIRY